MNFRSKVECAGLSQAQELALATWTYQVSTQTCQVFEVLQLVAADGSGSDVVAFYPGDMVPIVFGRSKVSLHLRFLSRTN